MATTLPSDPLLEAVQDIVQRRLDAFREASGKGLSAKEHLKASANGTTREDLGTLREARESLDERSRIILDAMVEVQRDFAVGYRCGVCGLTEAQAEAISYNCRLEC